jgi:hypothetical protein
VISPLVAGSSPALGTTMLIWNKPTTRILFSFSEDFGIEPFYVLGINELKKLRENTIGFFKALSGTPFEDLSSGTIEKALKEHHLDTNDLTKEYLQRTN